MEKWFSLHWRPEEEEEEEETQHLLQLHNTPFILPWPPHHLPWPPHHHHHYASASLNGFIPSSSSTSAEGLAGERSLAASKSHSQAEKRRRERINGHLSTLRRLVPHSDKMDKAALLGNVVDHVKELKRETTELGKTLTIPSDIDQVHVNVCDTSNLELPNATRNKDCIFLKATICCDDRPDLFTDIIGALKGLKLRAVRADMATMGGRIISVMVLCTNGENSVCLTSLKQSVKLVLSRVASFSSMASTNELSSKRRRMLLASN